MADRISMSSEEVRKAEVLRQVVDRVLTQRAAAAKLGLSTRQVRRLLKGYEAAGARAVIHGLRGRASNRRLDESFKAAVLERFRTRYVDFGPSLAAEYLRDEGYVLSKETLRQWLIEAQLWRPKPGRRQAMHPPRPRRPRVGELIQIDGSPHDWLEGRGPRCTLIAFIDDASSRVLEARFVPAETSRAYLDCVRRYVTRYGCPAAFYSDRHAIFTKHDPEDDVPTQFQRAISQLGIAGIQARSPQAKGRVERLFQTLQDRLLKALRLAGINDIEAANAALPEYLAQHNDRFAVAPADPEDAHLPCTLSAQALARVCAIHETRRLSKDLVLSFRRQRYIIQTGGTPRYSLRGAKVTVVTYSDGRIELLHGDELLPYKVFDPPAPNTEAVDEKTLEVRLAQVLKQRRPSKYRPPADHPWRRYPEPPSSGGGRSAPT